jgi:hypothetical protein
MTRPATPAPLILTRCIKRQKNLPKGLLHYWGSGIRQLLVPHAGGDTLLLGSSAWALIAVTSLLAWPIHVESAASPPVSRRRHCHRSTGDAVHHVRSLDNPFGLPPKVDRGGLICASRKADPQIRLLP